MAQLAEIALGTGEAASAEKGETKNESHA